MRFQDKVAVISGAADGIARATAGIMAREGAYVVAVDINGERLATLQTQIEAEGGKALAIQTDVMDAGQVQRMVQTALQTCGRIDILVNAVGGSTIIPNSRATLDELSLEEWERVIQFNLRGTFLCSNAIIKEMKKQGSGKIVNISSIAGHGMSANSGSGYATAKAGIMALTRKVAREVGPYGITCNAIAPGATASSRTGLATMSDNQRRQLVDPVPLGRVAQPEDQAKVIAFLASEDADYVTGVTIDVNGGRH